MSVIVALFGEENFAWPICKTENQVVTIIDTPMFEYWQQDDRQAFVNYAIQYARTARGNKVPVSTASRWFNLGSRVKNSSGDLWVHREGDELWWTITTSEPYQYTTEPPYPPIRHEPFMMIRKPAAPWSNKDRKGRPLTISGLHPKAKSIITTQSTQITPRNEGGAFVEALIDGSDLSHWHNLPEWKAKADTIANQRKPGSGGPVTTFSAQAIAAWRMADQAVKTTDVADGRVIETTAKIKNLIGLNQEELRRHVQELIDDQQQLCALTELRLQFDGEETDKELLASLDRIDSNGHYEVGNLQVVCRFANRWKSTDNNAMFLRLVDLLRN